VIFVIKNVSTKSLWCTYQTEIKNTNFFSILDIFLPFFCSQIAVVMQLPVIRFDAIFPPFFFFCANFFLRCLSKKVCALPRGWQNFFSTPGGGLGLHDSGVVKIVCQTLFSFLRIKTGLPNR